MQLLKSRKDYILLTGPALLIYALIIIFPILYSLFLGFFEWDATAKPVFIGLQNYKSIFTNPIFYQGLRNNILIVLISVGGQIPLGFILAYLLYRKLVNKAHFFQAMIFLPVAISSIVVAILWNQIFAPGGIFTTIMREIKDDPRYVLNVFQDKQLAIMPILFVFLWFYTGIYMIIFIANLQKIPTSIIESAFIDGAKEHQVLFRIILPNMTPVIYTTMVFAIAGSLKSFDLIFAMTGGGPAHFTEVIAIFMYTNTFKYYNYGLGSAVSIVIILLSLGLITLLQAVFAKLEKKYS